jgi:hypothetical protein
MSRLWHTPCILNLGAVACLGPAQTARDVQNCCTGDEAAAEI